MAYSFLEGSRGRKTETEASHGVTGTVLSFPAHTVTGSFCRKVSACWAGGSWSGATAALWQGVQ